MPAASVKVIFKAPGRQVVIDNLQHSQRITGSLQVTAGTGYEVGGIPVDQAILKLSGVQTNSGIREMVLWSRLGTGYIYQRTQLGNMMILQVPPAGSLTTAAPLQQLGSNAGSLSEVVTDVIDFEAYVNRNS